MNARIMIVILLLFFCLPHLATAQSKEYLNVLILPDSVFIINSKIIENCASRFAVEVQVNGSDIRIVERDTVVEKMRCICEYTLTAVLRGLAPGAYTVEIVREYLKKFGYGSDTTISIGSLTFMVGGGAAGPLGFTKSQSDCLNTSAYQPPDTPFLVTISPNPLRESALVSFTLEKGSPVDIEIYTPLGRRLWHHQVDNNAPGTHLVPLSSDMFPAAGQYFCRVFASDHSVVVPVFVIR